MNDPRTYVGIDVGGTFTDLALFDEAQGRFATVKVPSSPPTFWPSVIAGLESAGISETAETTILHGTTVHLNAFLERKGARTALVTTKGFGDVLEMRRGNRPEPYDLHLAFPAPLVPRADIYELDERLLPDGSVLTEPTAENIKTLCDRLAEQKYEAIAICFLHSYCNPVHEQLVADALRAALPDTFVSASSDVCRELREFERTSTAVINSYVSPVLKRYLNDLLKALEAKSKTRLFLLQSNGGLMSAKGAGNTGVLSLLSGPVGGNVAGRALSQATGIPNLICIDMGGTSFEASLVVDGESAVRTEREVGGFPIMAPMVDIHTIGAGGGSLAWNDAGALRVGPQSAGARPGPACYGHGGSQPTVTDANIALGRLEDGCAFGDLKLNATAARDVIADFAEQFGMSTDTMAQGMLDVINEQMANAIRTITIRRGIDPREFALVAYGGAGPMHAADVARLLDIETIVIPKGAGAFSAWGMLQSDLVYDQAESMLSPLTEADWAAMDARYKTLEAEAAKALADEGVPKDRMSFTRLLDVRYKGQENAISVALDAALFADPATAAQTLRRDFEADYEKTFGHSNPDEAVEIATLRLRSVGLSNLDGASLLSATDANELAKQDPRTSVVNFYGTPMETPFIPRANLSAGVDVSGPCVIEEATATTIVPPDFSATLDDIGNLILKYRGEKP